MKISKITLSVVSIITLILIIFVSRFAYSIGENNASLTVKETTPKQIAEAMQSDNYYGEYTKTILLISGTVTTLNQQGTDTIAQFEVTNSPSALGKVSCDLGSTNGIVKVGNNIRVLTVASEAKRKNTADVFMPNCYLLKE